MQISIPTQTPDAPAENGYRAESTSPEGLSGDSPALWGIKRGGGKASMGAAQKKNRNSLFAKLLEGISTKTRPDNNAAPQELSMGADGDPRIKKLEKTVSREKANDKKPPGRGNLGGIGSPDELIPFFWNGDAMGGLDFTLEQEKGGAAPPGSDGKLKSSIGKDFPKNNEGIFKTLDFIEGNNTPKETSEGEGNRSFPLDPSKNRAERGNSAASGGGDRAKNSGPGAPNYLSVSFREMDSAFQAQYQRVYEDLTKNGEGGKESTRLQGRTKKSGERLSAEVRELKAGAAEGPEKGSVELRSGDLSLRPSGPEIELQVDLGLSEEGEKGVFAKAGKDSSQGQRFEDALARELNGNLSTDIVRDASVIVRNGGEGSIRLSLKPASLGNVKIRLELTENKITGHIIVESNEAFRAFERELPVLEKAFRDSGFSETNLDMSLAQDGGNYGQGEQGQDPDWKALSPLYAASRYDAGSERTETSLMEEVSISGGIMQAHRTPVNMLV